MQEAQKSFSTAGPGSCFRLASKIKEFLHRPSAAAAALTAVQDHRPAAETPAGSCLSAGVARQIAGGAENTLNIQQRCWSGEEPLRSAGFARGANARVASRLKVAELCGQRVTGTCALAGRSLKSPNISDYFSGR